MMQIVSDPKDIELSKTDTLTKEGKTALSKYLQQKASYFEKDNFCNEAGNYAFGYDGMLTERSGLCHYAFSEAKKAEYAIDIQGRNLRPIINTRFMNWLYGPESPWKSIWPYVAVIKADPKDWNSLTKGIVITDTKAVHGHMAASLFITGRCKTAWATEHVWANLVDAGFTETVAYIIGLRYCWYQDQNYGHSCKKYYRPNCDNTQIIRTVPCNWETAVNLDTNFSPKSFINGTPNLTGDGFSNCGAIMQCNGIWGNGAKYGGGFSPVKTLKAGKELESLTEAARTGKSVPRELRKGIEESLRADSQVSI